MKKFKPTAYSHGPHAQAAHDAGGTLLQVPFNRAKWQAELEQYAPGCGSPIHVPGTSGGLARCGGTVGSTKVFCDYCRPSEAAKRIVATLLETETTVPEVEKYQALHRNWQCVDCGRIFPKKHQAHYCSCHAGYHEARPI